MRQVKEYTILFFKRERGMITTSELAVTITIWILTASGAFFGTRAVWRRRKLKRTDERAPHSRC